MDATTESTPFGRMLRLLSGTHQAIHLGVVTNHAANLPYHNADHAFETAERVHAAVADTSLDPRPLILAALYHDLDHTGTDNETVNIDRALTIWDVVGRERQLETCRWLGDTDMDWLDDVPRLIAATRWPWVPTARIDEIILRNADIAQTLGRPDWLGRWSEETGRPADPGFAARHLQPILPHIETGANAAFWAPEPRKP